MKAIFRHELSLCAGSMTTYVFGAFLLVFTGIGALIYNINASVANFEYVLGFISIVFVVIIPILTMRILAEERRQRTDQLLYSLPVTMTDVVLGKYLALLVVYLVPVAVIGFYPLLFSRYGEVYLPAAYGALAAFFFLGAALISIGMYISSLTESQGMAAGICVAVLLFLYYSATLADYVSSTAVGSLAGILVVVVLLGFLARYLTGSELAGGLLAGGLALAALAAYVAEPSLLEGLLPQVMHQISLFERFEIFVNGIFDLTVLVYDCSVTAFFLFLCVQSLEKRRYSG